MFIELLSSGEACLMILKVIPARLLYYYSTMQYAECRFTPFIVFEIFLLTISGTTVLSQ